MTTWVHPASAISRSSFCTSQDSGVVPVGRQDRPADHVLVGADEPHLGPQHALQHRLEQIGGGRLAVGPGDGQRRQAIGRAAEPVGGDRRQRRPRIRDHDPWSRFFRRMLAEHRGGPQRQRLGNKSVSVGLVARQRRKQTAGHQFSGVVANS